MTVDNRIITGARLDEPDLPTVLAVARRRWQAIAGFDHVEVWSGSRKLSPEAVSPYAVSSGCTAPPPADAGEAPALVDVEPSLRGASSRPREAGDGPHAVPVRGNNVRMLPCVGEDPRQADALEPTDMLCSPAHELAEPLAALTNYLQAGRQLLAQSVMTTDDQLTQFVMLALGQAARAATIVHRLQDCHATTTMHLSRACPRAISRIDATVFGREAVVQGVRYGLPTP